MTVSRLYMPAVTLAGALALAGCGGGSNTTTTPMVTMPDPDPDPMEPMAKTLKLPGTNAIQWAGPGQAGPSGPQVIRAGKTVNIGGTYFSCAEGDMDCTIEAGQGRAVSVRHTGGTLTASATDPRPTSGSQSGSLPRPEADTDPVSETVIAEALKGPNSKATVWGDAGTSVNFTNTKSFENLDGETVALTLDGDAALYWGNWHKYRAPATPSGKRTDERLGQIYGGTTPRYGKKPESTIDEATYGSTDRVNLQFKDGTRDWTGNATSTADLSLTANFKAGKVDGAITGVTAVTATGFPDEITLKETDIGSAGGFSGTAEFKGTTVTRKSGSWKGDFYGPTTEVQDREQVHVAPSHVAGTFSASGRHGTGSTAKDLHVRGAFGAEKN